MKVRFQLMSSLAVIALACPSAAFAQAATEETDSGEIVVTAMKRETNLQETPAAITVSTGEDLTKGGVSDLRSLETISPNLNIRTDTIFTQVSIRGIGSTGTGEIQDPAVTFSIDGEALSRPVALNAAMMDVSRVEVLAGPQGTLYGRNATAGAVNIIANKPGSEFAIGGNIELGSYSAFNTSGFVNIPLSDSVATRVSFMSARHDGYLDNGPGGHGDDQNVWGARLSTKFNLGESATLLITGEHTEVQQSSTVPYGVDVNAPFGIPLAAGTVPGNFTVKIPQDGWPLADIGFFDSEQSAIRAELNLDLGFADLTYFGAFRDVNTTGRTPVSGRVPDTIGFDNRRLDYKTLTQELRLSGGSDESFFWQIGGSYVRETQVIARGGYRPAATATTVANQYVFYANLEAESDAYGVFAQGTIRLADTLKFTAGGRMSWDKKGRSGLQCGPGGPCIATTNNGGPWIFPNPPGPTVGAPPGAITSYSDSKFTWTVGLDWQVAPDNLLYAKVSTGYKAGGFDSFAGFDPETITAYELGSKNEFMDGALRLNLAAYHYDYVNQQTTVFVPEVAGNRTLNIGKSRVRGLDVEMLAKPSENDTIRVTLNYLDAVFTDFRATQPRIGAPSAQVNLAGNRPIQAPKWSIVYGYDHTFPLASGAKVIAGISGRFKSSYFTNTDNYLAGKQESFTNTDLNLSYVAPDEKWKLTAFVRNLEDKRPLGHSAANTGFSFYHFVLSGAPRTFGGRLEFNF